MAAERITNEGLSLVGRGKIAENTMSTRISDAIANFFGVNEYRGETGEIQQNRVAEYQTLKEQLGYMRGFDSGYKQGYAEAQFAQFVAEEVVTTVATLGVSAILSSARITAAVGRAGVQGMRLGGKILGRSAYRSMLQSGVGRTLTKTGYGGIRGLALARTSRAANLLSRDMFSAGRMAGVDGRMVAQLPNRPTGIYGGGGGPRVRSIYEDGTRVYQGQQPPRISGPNSAAQGPHSVLRWDNVNNRVYQAREFNSAGHPIRDIDFTSPTYPNGIPRPDHLPPPHQHSWFINDPLVGPRSGFRRGGPELLW